MQVVHGSVAAVVVFLLWIYLSAVILLYGVEVAAAYTRLRKHLPSAAPAAAMRDPPRPRPLFKRYRRQRRKHRH